MSTQVHTGACAVTSGRSSGWFTYQYPPGTWHWSAYGPNGGTSGVALTRDEATRRAEG